jgi:MFS family permease
MTTGLSALVRQPLWRRWTLAAFLGRLPMTMTLLALVLVGKEVSGSLAVGAQLAGVATVTAGLAAPLRGRQLDRGGLRVGLQRAAVITGVVLLAEAGAAVAGAPLAVFYGLAALQGVALAALSGGFRALLVPVVPPEDLPRANTLEAVFIEVAFVAGPSLAGVLALLVGPVGVLFAMAAAAFGSAWLTGGLPDVEPSEHGIAAAPWRAPGAKPVYLLAFAMGMSLGLLESAVPARAEALGMAAASAGPLLALVAIGSAVGGLFAATRRDQGRHQVRIAVALLVVLGALNLAVAAAGGIVTLGIWLLLLGAPIAPLNAIGAMRLQATIPPTRLGEGFALYTSMILVGAGIGQSITGQALDNVGAQALLAAAGVVPAAAAVAITAVVLRGRRTARLGRPATEAR